MKFYLIVASVSGLLAIILGAFGVHALKDSISADMLDAYKTGIQYQFYHTFAIALVGILMHFNKSRHLRWAGNLFILGTFIFSGMIYIMAITGYRALGIVPAFGGLILISGWIFLLAHCLTLAKRSY